MVKLTREDLEALFNAGLDPRAWFTTIPAESRVEIGRFVTTAGEMAAAMTVIESAMDEVRTEEREAERDAMYMHFADGLGSE